MAPRQPTETAIRLSPRLRSDSPSHVSHVLPAAQGSSYRESYQCLIYCNLNTSKLWPSLFNLQPKARNSSGFCCSSERFVAYGLQSSDFCRSFYETQPYWRHQYRCNSHHSSLHPTAILRPPQSAARLPPALPRLQGPCSHRILLRLRFREVAPSSGRWRIT